MKPDEIVIGGDMMNHAIFTQNEIDDALKKLVPAGYIETDKAMYRATEKAIGLSNCLAYRRAGLFGLTEVIHKMLNNMRGGQKGE